MSTSHNYTIALTLLLVAGVGIAGLYFATSGSQEGGVIQTVFGGGLLITGADIAQTASADFNVSPTINIQFKSFGDSNSIAANITSLQNSTTCNFLTAAANETGFFPNTTSNTTFNLTNATNGQCTVTYSTLSEPQNSTGAFGVENLGSVDIRVNASDASGCAFSESAPASCVRQIVANQQTIGDCNVTNSTNFCIRTVGTNQGSDAIRYVTFSTSEVILCD
ncbi:MAG TPA: hypothetical protein VI612_01730, partial [Candidatus Nanoarchaeia archaeon]|nr:hypothetical protein [Candidatus Nanoarchaeia archaeon]